MTKRQRIPAPRVLERSVLEHGPIVEGLGGGTVYEVLSWREGEANSGEPCTQVHLVVPVVDGIRVALRLKSARALDELVGVLLQYRREVWP